MRFRMGWNKIEVRRGGYEVVGKHTSESVASDGVSLVKEVKTVERFGIAAVFDDA